MFRRQDDTSMGNSVRERGLRFIQGPYRLGQLRRVSPDRKLIVSCSGEKTVQIWNAEVTDADRSRRAASDVNIMDGFLVHSQNCYSGSY